MGGGRSLAPSSFNHREIIMKRSWNYEVKGSGADGQTWEITGNVVCDFINIHPTVMRDTFGKLTEGKAVFGKPGVGCEGPYDIHRVLIEQVRH